VRYNIFEGKTAVHFNMWDTGDSESIEISHNTLVGNGAVLLQVSAPPKVTFRRNLFAGHSSVQLEKSVPSERISTWTTDHNYYQGHAKFGDNFRAPLGPTDRVMPFRFLSKPPGTRDYARLPKPVSGGEDEIPEGVGALPSGPAPKDGDWFTRLQESWFEEPAK